MNRSGAPVSDPAGPAPSGSRRIGDRRSVSMRATVEALRKVYEAGKLAEELTKGKLK